MYVDARGVEHRSGRHTDLRIVVVRERVVEQDGGRPVGPAEAAIGPAEAGPYVRTPRGRLQPALRELHFKCPLRPGGRNPSAIDAEQLFVHPSPWPACGEGV